MRTYKGLLLYLLTRTYNINIKRHQYLKNDRSVLWNRNCCPNANTRPPFRLTLYRAKSSMQTFIHISTKNRQDRKL